MNKKKKKPELFYPFKDKEHEESNKQLDFVRSKFISDQGSEVKLVQTHYRGKYRKLVLTETLYLKDEGSNKKLSELLYLRPSNEVHTNKYLVFNATIKKEGIMHMTRENIVGKIAEFNKNETRLILYFYKRPSVSLEEAAVDSMQAYSGEGSVRTILHRINSKFTSLLALPPKDKLIFGDQGKAYAFDKNIRLNIVDERISK